MIMKRVDVREKSMIGGACSVGIFAIRLNR